MLVTGFNLFSRAKNTTGSAGWPESPMIQFLKIEQFLTPKCIRPDLKKDGKSKGQKSIGQNWGYLIALCSW
jgi:hypothetical protein